MVPHRLTRRQALRLARAQPRSARYGPSPAFAAAGPALFELAIRDAGAQPRARWRTTPVLPRRGASTSSACAGARPHSRPRSAPAPPAGAGHAGRRCPATTGDVTGTDPVFTGTADELQLRLRGDARA